MCAIVEREGTQWEGVCVCVWKRTCTCANAVIFINLCTSIYWLVSCLILNYAIKTLSASVVKLNPPGDLYVPTTPCACVCVCVLFVFCSSPVTFRSMCDRCSSSHARTHTKSLLHSLSLSLPPQTQLQFDCFHFWLIVQCRRIFCHKQQFESNASAIFSLHKCKQKPAVSVWRIIITTTTTLAHPERNGGNKNDKREYDVCVWVWVYWWAVSMRGQKRQPSRQHSKRPRKLLTQRDYIVAAWHCDSWD